jgi:hypothetical protein
VFELTDADLVKRVMTNLRVSCGIACVRWGVITEVFAIGSTSAKELCVLYGYDPDEILPSCNSNAE